MTQNNRAIELKNGLKAGFPIALGYLPIGTAFGLLTRSSGMPAYSGILMSLLVFAGASQFVGINLLSLGASALETGVAAFILNLRHILMSSSVSQKLSGNISKSFAGVIAFGVTDETFAVASTAGGLLSPWYLVGLNFISYAAWNTGTWVGLFLASGLPELLKSSMGIALYAMFIGLLLPHTRKSKAITTVAIISMAVNSLISYLPLFSFITSGWGIIIATICGAGAGVMLFGGENSKC